MCGRYALGDEFEEVQGRVNAEYFQARPRRNQNRAGQGQQQQQQQQDERQRQLDFPAANDDHEPVIPGEQAQWAPGTPRDKYRPRFNVAPQTFCPVIRYNDQGHYVIELMKWGLIPHWQKQPPDAPLKTINARDDTVASGTGMWAGLRGRNRCIVIAQGFFEWLKKGNDKIPHFTKPADGKYLVMAGLFDSVKFEGADETLKTFTIITTSSNKQLNFLHDRMPAILSELEEIEMWLKPGPWSPELQKLIRPFEGKLECYKVPQEVGSVKNDSPDFIKPVSERKGNLASFFAKTPTKSAPPAGYGSQKSEIKEGLKDEQTKEDLRLNPDDADDSKPKRGRSNSSSSGGSSVEVVDPPVKKRTKKQKRSESPDEQGNMKVTSFFNKES